MQKGAGDPAWCSLEVDHLTSAFWISHCLEDFFSIISFLRSLKVVELVTSLRYSTGHVSCIFYLTILQLGRRYKTRDRGRGECERNESENRLSLNLLVDLGQDPIQILVSGPRWVTLESRRRKHTQSPGRGGTPPRRP